MTDLERIARLLCEADGSSPDEMVWPFQLAVDRWGRPVKPMFDPEPGWHRYATLVQVALDIITTTAGDGDLAEIIQDILSGKDVPAAEPQEIQVAPPEPAPDWRYRYGLQR